MTNKAHAYRRRLLVNAASTGAGNVWAMALAVVTLPLLLRGLGSTAFGVWVLVQTLSAVNGWLSLADLGVGAATTVTVGRRLGADDHDGVGRAIRTSVLVFVALGLGFGALVSLVAPHVLPAVFNVPSGLRADVRMALVLFGGQILVDTVTEGCEACLEGLQRVDLSRLIDGARRTLVAVGTVVAALAGAGLRGVAAASLGASVLGALGALAVLGREQPAGTHRFDRAGVRPLFGYGVKVAAIDASGVLHRTVDRVLVGAIVGPAAVTLVEIATQIMNGASATMSAASYPVSSGAALLAGRDDPKATRQLLERGTILTLLVTWPVVIAAALLAGPLVRLWVGAGYHEAAGLAVIALMDVALVAPVQVGSNILRGIGTVGRILRPALVAVAVNVVASVALVYAVGTVGTFLGSLIGVAVLTPLLARAFLSEMGLGVAAFLRSSVLPVLVPLAALAAVLAGVVALDLPDGATVALGLALGGAAYAAVTLLTVLPPAQLRELAAVGSGPG